MSREKPATPIRAPRRSGLRADPGAAPIRPPRRSGRRADPRAWAPRGLASPGDRGGQIRGSVSMVFRGCCRI